MFAVLLLAAALAVAPHLRMLSEQQEAIAALEADVAERENTVEHLEAELRRWDDPAFVKARARERLFMVMPGEVGYVVVDPPVVEEPEQAAEAAVADAVEASGERRAWYGTLWESVQLAGADEATS